MEQRDKDLEWELSMSYCFNEHKEIIKRYSKSSEVITIKDLLVYSPESRVLWKAVQNHLVFNGLNILNKDLINVINNELNVGTVRKIKGSGNKTYLEDVSIITPNIRAEGLTPIQQEIALKAKKNLMNHYIQTDYTPKQLTLELSGNKLGVAYDIKNRGEDLIRLKKKVDGYHKVHDIDNRTCELTICLVKRGIIDSNPEFHCLKNDVEYYPKVPKEGYDMNFVRSLTRHRGRMFEKGYQGLVEQGFYSIRPGKDTGELPPSSYQD